MIDYVKGELTELTPAMAVVECGGVGYAVHISLNTYSAIQGKSMCKLYVHEAIREDAYVLYGFIDRRERELFLNLISVSGVGPSTARVILSSLTTADLENAIISGNLRVLKAVKGIGAKTAERIIVDLKDKIKPGSDTLSIHTPAENEVFDEALAALVMLGFTKAQSEKALTKLFKENPGVAVEQAIKQALKMM